jgi:hypothetical protein
MIVIFVFLVQSGSAVGCQGGADVKKRKVERQESVLNKTRTEISIMEHRLFFLPLSVSIAPKAF